jgi:phage terminase small subunit
MSQIDQTHDLPARGARLSAHAKQLGFIQEYLVDLNGKDAAIRAGYSPRSAHVTASRILADPRVRSTIAASIEERFGVTKESIIEELAAIAFASLGDHFSWDAEGRIRSKPSRSLTQAQKRAVASIRQVRSKTGAITQVSLPDKLRALELLARLSGAMGDTGTKGTRRHG